jgi:hypothetical protein
MTLVGATLYVLGSTIGGALAGAAVGTPLLGALGGAAIGLGSSIYKLVDNCGVRPAIAT